MKTGLCGRHFHWRCVTLFWNVCWSVYYSHCTVCLVSGTKYISCVPQWLRITVVIKAAVTHADVFISLCIIYFSTALWEYLSWQVIQVIYRCEIFDWKLEHLLPHLCKHLFRGLIRTTVLKYLVRMSISRSDRLRLDHWRGLTWLRCVMLYLWVTVTYHVCTQGEVVGSLPSW